MADVDMALAWYSSPLESMSGVICTVSTILEASTARLALLPEHQDRAYTDWAYQLGKAL
jgi:hypothetical protein